MAKAKVQDLERRVRALQQENQCLYRCLRATTLGLRSEPLYVNRPTIKLTAWLVDPTGTAGGYVLISREAQDDVGPHIETHYFDMLVVQIREQIMTGAKGELIEAYDYVVRRFTAIREELERDERKFQLRGTTTGRFSAGAQS